MTKRLVIFVVFCCCAVSGSEVQGQKSLEQGIIAEINKVRSNPHAYANWIEANLRSLPLASKVEPATINEAIRVLRATAPLPVLTYSNGIYKASVDHIKDQIATGLAFDHIGTDGGNPITRMKRYGVFKSPGYENGSVMHTNSAETIVLAWVIDNGNAEPLHREAILSARVRFLAAACAVYPVTTKAKGATLCVANFAGDYKDKP